ncbi:MAG: hypothetical protein ABI323_09195 [Solirubrobacteraceae bacterium]
MKHEISVGGTVREYYFAGLLDRDDQAKWNTEIGWPIFRSDPQACLGSPKPSVPALAVAARDAYFLASVVERNQPALPGAKPSSRAADRDRADTKVLVEPQDRDRPATLAASVLRHPFSGLLDLPLKDVSLSNESLTLGGQSVALRGQSVPLFTGGGFLSFKFLEATGKR